MADRDAERVRRAARIRRAEQNVEAAAERSIGELLDLAAEQLRSGNYDPAVLDARHPAWSATLEEYLLPAVTEAYIAGLAQEAEAGTIDATAYVSRHLDEVRNRLVRVADTTFDVIRSELRVGYLQGEDIPTLSKRVDAVLSAGETWRNRARVVARTEVIGANNAGARDAARIHAGILGADTAVVVKEWLATSDERTRETHAAADGQQVVGIDTPFLVGGYALTQPGDPSGPAREVIQCRCTTLYLYPGDPGYPEELAAQAAPQPPADGGAVDVTTLSDADLEAEMIELGAMGDYDSPRAVALAAELDRRDAVNLDVLPETPEPIIDATWVDESLGVRDLTVSRVGRPDLTPSQRKSASRERERADYECYIDSQWIRAENDLNGVLLTPRARFEGIDARDLFTRRLRSLKHASPELQEWFAANGRLSFDEWRGRRSKTRGYESEYG